MEYYVQVGPDGSSCGTWAIGDGMAKRLGILNAETVAGAHVRAAPGESEMDALRRGFPQFFTCGKTHRFIKTVLGPGEYYPRMARPSGQHLSDSPGVFPGEQALKNEIAIIHGQIAVLVSSLESICRTVHPQNDNLNTYGHEIRNLLILACTEAEAQWRAILEANTAVPQNRRVFTTNDYVKLAPAMKLGEYGVSFSSYPWLPVIKPFDGWGTTGAPTQDLTWYRAYNAVKHDREGRFSEATLIHVFHAVAAVFVLLFAQFGLNQRMYLEARGLHLINLINAPLWDPSESYLWPLYVGGPVLVPHPSRQVIFPF